MSNFSTNKSIIRVGNLQVDSIPVVEDVALVPLPEEGDTIMDCIQKLTNAILYILAIMERDGQTVVNGVGLVDNKVDNVTTSFNAAKEELDFLKANVSIDKATLNSVRTAVGDLTDRVAALEANP